MSCCLVLILSGLSTANSKVLVPYLSLPPPSTLMASYPCSLALVAILSALLWNVLGDESGSPILSASSLKSFTSRMRASLSKYESTILFASTLLLVVNTSLPAANVSATCFEFVRYIPLPANPWSLGFLVPALLISNASNFLVVPCKSGSPCAFTNSSALLYFLASAFRASRGSVLPTCGSL